MAWLQLAPKTARPVPSRNEDVCGERLKNLYSEKRDEKDEVVREAVVSIWSHNALRHSFGSYDYPNIVTKTGLLQRWEIHPLSSSVITGHW
jgi:hypothetical protein